MKCFSGDILELGAGFTNISPTFLISYDFKRYSKALEYSNQYI